MADQATALPFAGGAQKWVDNGDGTYSMGVAVVSGGGGGGATTSTVTGNVASGATDSGNAVKVGGLVNTGTPASLTTGQRGDVWLNARGAVEVGAFASAGADATGNALALLTTQTGTPLIGGAAGFVFNGTTYDRQRGDTTGTYVVQRAATAGGTLTARMISAAGTNPTSVKTSAGQIYGIQLSNSGAVWAFAKLYNKASAPTVGTDIPIELIGIPPGGRVEINRPVGMPFAAGIALAVTAGVADTDTTAVIAGQVVGSIHYA